MTAAGPLLVDVYRLNLGGHPRWAPLVADPRYVGAILKATDGVSYPTAWFVREWKAVKTAAAARYGRSFLRGAYHYLRFSLDPVRQARFYLDTIEAAGGWDRGDLIPIVDVERGQVGGENHAATGAQVVAATTAFIAEVKRVTKQAVMLYGRGAMRELHITSRMGAAVLWNPSYTQPMRSTVDQGWPDAQVALWQYTNGTINKTTLPTRAPGLGAVDASVFLHGDFTALATMLGRTGFSPAPTLASDGSLVASSDEASVEASSASTDDSSSDSALTSSTEPQLDEPS